ncbi:MAG: hypothetical protein WC868_02090 [Bacteroidales bacterium]
MKFTNFQHKVNNGKKWSRESVKAAMDILAEEFTPLSDARSEAEFRRMAAKNLLMKFYLGTNTLKTTGGLSG